MPKTYEQLPGSIVVYKLGRIRKSFHNHSVSTKNHLVDINHLIGPRAAFIADHERESSSFRIVEQRSPSKFYPTAPSRSSALGGVRRRTYLIFQCIHRPHRHVGLTVVESRHDSSRIERCIRNAVLIFKRSVSQPFDP